MSTTVNDPKGEAGAKKAPMWLLPPVALEQTAWVHKLGNDKYGPFNWRKTGVCATTYVSAIMRHLNAWRDGEDLDPESGISHIAHIATSCNILMDAAACRTLQDDRNKRPRADRRAAAFGALIDMGLSKPTESFLDRFVAEFDEVMANTTDEELVESFREMGCDVEVEPGKIEVDGEFVDLPPVPEGYSRWVDRGTAWDPDTSVMYQYYHDSGYGWSDYTGPGVPSGDSGRYIEAVKDGPVGHRFGDIRPGDKVTGRLVHGEDFCGTLANVVDIRGTKLFQFLDRASITEDEIYSITRSA